MLKVGTRTQKTTILQLCSKETLQGGGYVAIGRIDVDVSQQRNAVLTFRARTQNTTALKAGKIQLYDVTGIETLIAEEDVTLTSELIVEVQIPQTADVIRTLEVRAGLDPLGTYADVDAQIVWGAYLELKG